VGGGSITEPERNLVWLSQLKLTRCECFHGSLTSVQTFQQVIGNTGSNSTKEAMHATEQGFEVGMDASLQINPYYGKTSKTGLLEHFRLVRGT
jgi:dihydrodipicolinate synthase/N-acetylneuraminate lyase